MLEKLFPLLLRMSKAMQGQAGLRGALMKMLTESKWLAPTGKTLPKTQKEIETFVKAMLKDMGKGG